MSESQNQNSSQKNGDTDPAVVRRSNPKGLSTNEMVNRAFREPYFLFLLFLMAVRRRIFWILPAGIFLGACFGSMYYLCSALTYKSETWVRIYNEPRYIAFRQQYSGEETKAMVQAHLQLIKSPPVLENAWAAILEKAETEGINISKLQRVREPVDWLAANIGVERRGESPVYIFSFATEDPRLSQLILSSIMTSYFAFMTQNNRSKETYQRASLRENANIKRQEIEQLHTQYLRVANEITSQGGELPSELNRVILAQTPLATQIIEIEGKIKAQEIILQLSKKVLADDSEVDDAEIARYVYSSPLMQQLTEERVALLDELEKVTVRRSDESPTALRIRKKLDEVEVRIQRAQEKLAAEAKQFRKVERYEAALNKVEESEQLIEQLKSQAGLLREANKSQQSKEGGMSRLVGEAMEILTMKNREEQVYNTLLSQIGILDTESSAPEQVDQISKASFPNHANTAARNRMTVMLCLFGFIIPVLAAWGLESLVPRFYHPSQFSIQFPDLALETVADVPMPGREHLMTDRQKQAYYFSIDETCNDLCFGQSFLQTQVFLFSSIIHDDGQSQLALSIAERLAQIRKKPVLLIDTHGSNPLLRNLFGDAGKGSLADILSLRLGLGEAIVSDPEQTNLYFLPDGPASGHATIGQFGDGKFGMLLAELKKHYSTIIISAAPMENSTAAQMLCHYADSIVLSLRIRETYRKNTERICERLGSIGTPVRAFLVSGVTSK